DVLVAVLGVLVVRRHVLVVLMFGEIGWVGGGDLRVCVDVVVVVGALADGGRCRGLFGGRLWWWFLSDWIYFSTSDEMIVRFAVRLLGC
ncbi:hypothetical protein AAHH78_32680, partial [Burkholderia pseudomallei]